MQSDTQEHNRAKQRPPAKQLETTHLNAPSPTRGGRAGPGAQAGEGPLGTRTGVRAGGTSRSQLPIVLCRTLQEGNNLSTCARRSAAPCPSPQGSAGPVSGTRAATSYTWGCSICSVHTSAAGRSPGQEAHAYVLYLSPINHSAVVLSVTNKLFNGAVLKHPGAPLNWF